VWWGPLRISLQDLVSLSQGCGYSQSRLLTAAQPITRERSGVHSDNWQRNFGFKTMHDAGARRYLIVGRPSGKDSRNA